MKRGFFTVLVTLLAMLLMASPVLAYLTPPDSGMSIQSARVFRNLVTDNDSLVIFHYRIPYDTPPTEASASDSIAFRLYDTDGTTLLKTSTPYVFASFETNGYGDGVSAVYSENSTLTWDGSHKIVIEGLPLHYDDLPPATYTLTSADFADTDVRLTNRANLYLYVMGICDTFKTIYSDIVLKSSTDAATVLSEYGESYFRNAVVGIQSMCPQLFYAQTYIPEVMAVEPYDLSLPDAYAIRLVGTDVHRGATRLGDEIGVGAHFLFAILTFVSAIGMCIFTMRKGWGLEPGMVAAFCIGLIAALLVGDVLFGIVMIVSLLAGIGIMFVFFQKRA